MENTERPSKRMPIDFESDADDRAENAQEKRVETAGNSSNDSFVARAGNGKADDGEETKSYKQPEETKSYKQTEAKAESPSPGSDESSSQSGNLSPAEVAQILIDIADAQERAAKLGEEKKIVYEQLMRRQAEFENFRKRVAREREETQTRVRADVIAEILPVLDNLERALYSGKHLDSADSSINEGIVVGVKLIHKQFLDVLCGLGLMPVKALGESFDPHIHEAVTTEENNQYPENTIVEELQRGYKLGERLLRPAMVKVAVRERDGSQEY